MNNPANLVAMTAIACLLPVHTLRYPVSISVEEPWSWTHLQGREADTVQSILFLIRRDCIDDSSGVLGGHKEIERIPYSDLMQHLKAGEVAEILIGSEKIQDPCRLTVNKHTGFSTPRIPIDLTPTLETHHVRYGGAVERTCLSDLLPVVVFFGLWAFFFRKIAVPLGGGAPDLRTSLDRCGG